MPRGYEAVSLRSNFFSPSANPRGATSRGFARDGGTLQVQRIGFHSNGQRVQRSRYGLLWRMGLSAYSADRFILNFCLCPHHRALLILLPRRVHTSRLPRSSSRFGGSPCPPRRSVTALAEKSKRRASPGRPLRIFTFTAEESSPLAMFVYDCGLACASRPEK